MAFIYTGIIAVIFIVELCIKNYVEKHRSFSDNIPMAGGMLVLTKYHNKGAFLNLGARNRQLVAAASVLLTLAVTGIFVMTFSARGSVLLKSGLALLLGGAFSNTYDRMKRKYVVDYFSFGVGAPKLKRIVFNISDFCIAIGALCIVLGSYERT